MATKTQEEIEALKASWLKDPCWDDELEFKRTNQEDEVERQERLALYRCS